MQFCNQKAETQTEKEYSSTSRAHAQQVELRMMPGTQLNFWSGYATSCELRMMLAFVHLPIPLLDVGSESAGAPTRKEKLS